MALSVKQKLCDYMHSNDADKVRISRLILAAIDDRDITYNCTLSEQDIVVMLEETVQYKKTLLASYDHKKEKVMVARTEKDIAFIKTLIPHKKGEEEVEHIIAGIIKEIAGAQLKDAAMVMARLRARYPQNIDQQYAVTVTKKLLDKA